MPIYKMAEFGGTKMPPIGECFLADGNHNG